MKHLFIDMDGVLSDFDSKWVDVFNEHPRESFNSEKWKRFCEGRNFLTLDLYPGASQLIAYLNELKKFPDISINILSSTGGYEYHDLIQDQKIYWLKSHRIDLNPIFVPGKKFKRYHAKVNTLLIDDHAENCAEFVQHGGVSHLYTEPGQAIIFIDEFLKGNYATTAMADLCNQQRPMGK